MKMEALSHQGIACGQVGHKSRDDISDTDSGRQVQRYIRLTYLIPELLEKMDKEEIAFSVGVELSYLDEYSQRDVLEQCEINDCTPSYSQALKFREDRSGTTALYGWKQNRLPVITDIRLTCRLWSPADHSERMSLLYLTANAVAAKRPTKRYLSSIREFAIQLGKQAPEYSEICLPAYFDDVVTDTILKYTMGEEEKLDINSFATSIAELSEWKAKEQEEITNQVIAERDGVSDELKNQTQSIIDGAVESGRKLLGWRKPALWLIVKWPVTVTVIFSAITAGISLIIGNWHPMWAIALPTVLKIIETCSTSNFVGKPLAKWLLPKIDESISKRISKELRKAERTHEDTIIRQIKEQTELWVECKKISES